MLLSLIALFFRIVSNPVANAAQKLLAKNHSAILINMWSFAVLSIFCLYPASMNKWAGYDISFWGYVFGAGILCTFGSVCLIKALQYGEMSVLGPINSYKCLVGLVFGFFILGETPTVIALLGVVMIIFGSWYIFDTVDGGFNFKLLLRKDIFLRFCALFCTGCEAVVLKKIILLSSVLESFILWCFSGLLFSILLMILFRIKVTRFSNNESLWILVVAFCLGVMQLSTNIVFEKFNVGLSLALFQLSSILTVFLGYFMFKEGSFLKKLSGTVVMVIGSCLVLLN